MVIGLTVGGRYVIKTPLMRHGSQGLPDELTPEPPHAIHFGFLLGIGGMLISKKCRDGRALARVNSGES